MTPLHGQAVILFTYILALGQILALGFFVGFAAFVIREILRGRK